ILKQDTLQKEMNEIIEEVAQMVDLSHGAIRILLNRFKWDKESLLERFYECEDMGEFLRRLRIVLEPSIIGQGVDGQEAECDICCGVEVLTGPKCRHYTCTTCWEQYLNTKILVQNTSNIECLFPGCKLLLTDELVTSLIGSNESARAAHRRLSINGFVQSNRRLKWCPAVDCGRAIKVRDCAEKAVECACGCRFCFACGHEWHEPIDCILLKAWLRKCEDDSETSNWINGNTKDCPKCRVAIEKNGGCNRIHCTQSTCGYQFCWMCLQDWNVHGYEKACNVFDESQVRQYQDSRACLERYLHYYTRFINHKQSRKLETNLRESVKKQMDDMQSRSMSWIEVQFLNKPVDVLAECRQTLMYTYAFAFYLKKTHLSEIFEANQRDLELATEQLSGFLERDLATENEKGFELIKI
ncbi:hypothetical protein PENTCL1PPCAC_4236, partial [Pristionchus entomophagus]